MPALCCMMMMMMELRRSHMQHSEILKGAYNKHKETNAQIKARVFIVARIKVRTYTIKIKTWMASYFRPIFTDNVSKLVWLRAAEEHTVARHMSECGYMILACGFDFGITRSSGSFFVGPFILVSFVSARVRDLLFVAMSPGFSPCSCFCFPMDNPCVNLAAWVLTLRWVWIMITGFARVNNEPSMQNWAVLDPAMHRKS